MELTEQQLDMPVSQLSVRQLLALIGNVDFKKGTDGKLFGDGYLKGLDGLANYLSCSKASVSRYMKAGILKNTFIVSGRTHWFEKDKIDVLVKSNPIFH